MAGKKTIRFSILVGLPVAAFGFTSCEHRKLMLAIAGGVPPDVAGVCGRTIPVYAENNELLPLEK